MTGPSTRHDFFDGADRLARSELEALQLTRLRAQLERVYARAAFYRRRFDAAGLRPDIGSIAEFQARAPFMHKIDLLGDQEQEPPFGTRLTVEPDEVRRIEITSGTSGLGQEVYALTERDLRSVGETAAWAFAMRGVQAGDRIAIMLPMGYLQGPWGAHWGAEQLGAGVVHLGLAPDSVSRLRYLARFGVDVLFTPTPTYLMRLSKVAQEIGFDPRTELPGLKTAWLAGESYPADWALRMEAFWGTRFLESYGSTQGGMAASCEHGVVSADGTRGQLHVVDWNVLIEVLDPETLEPVPPGTTGEAVLTTLTRQATPCVRFRTGDLVRTLPVGSCPCGRQTTVFEAGTVGRLDDMVKIKGMNVWPAAIDSIVLGSAGVSEYMAHVGVDEHGHEFAELQVFFETLLPVEDRLALLDGLATRVRAATNVTMRLREGSQDDLPQFEYKARRWHDARAEGLLAGATGLTS